MSACSDDPKPNVLASTSQPVTTTIKARPQPKLTFTTGPTTAVGTGGAAKLTSADERAARRVVQQYIDVASWAPQSGQRTKVNISKVVAAPLVAYLDTHNDDELVFTDRKAQFKATTMRANITLHAVMNAEGTAGAIAAELSTRSTDGTATTKRSGELLLRPIDGRWQIAGFQLTVQRSRGDGSPATTTTTEVKP